MDIVVKVIWVAACTDVISIISVYLITRYITTSAMLMLNAFSLDPALISAR